MGVNQARDVELGPYFFVVQKNKLAGTDLCTPYLQPNKSNHLAPPIPAELTSGFRLLGSPVGSPTFAREFFNDQRSDVQTKITLLSEAITNPQTKLRLFSQCLIQKLPHLLGSDVLHHFDPINPPPDWTDWDGPLTSTTNHIITKFLSDITGTTSLPHHALLIAQLNINAGGLGIMDPRSVAILDFMLSFTSARRHATNGIYQQTPPHSTNPLTNL